MHFYKKLNQTHPKGGSILKKILFLKIKQKSKEEDIEIFEEINESIIIEEDPKIKNVEEINEDPIIKKYLEVKTIETTKKEIKEKIVKRS